MYIRCVRRLPKHRTTDSTTIDTCKETKIMYCSFLRSHFSTRKWKEQQFQSWQFIQHKIMHNFIDLAIIYRHEGESCCITSKSWSLASSFNWFSSFFCLSWPSMTILARRALIWTWVLVHACRRPNVVCAWFLTESHCTSFCNLTFPLIRQKLLLA